MRILITGNLGYVGSVLVPFLKKHHPEMHLMGVDSGLFAHALIGSDAVPEIWLDVQRFIDIRNITPRDLDGIDTVVHLAAISNDPMGNQFAEQTEAINHRATMRLAQLAVESKVKRFVFASSCSVYGATHERPKREIDPLAPLTAYARSKIAVEQDLAQLDYGDMQITNLRFATACGDSDRLRLDLVLNDFVASAVTQRRITILSDGTPWRPLIDTQDMARAIAWAIQRESGDGGTFLTVNVGRNEANYQIRELAEAVARMIPGVDIDIQSQTMGDARSYQVDFSLFTTLAGHHTPKVSLEQSILSLKNHLEKASFSDAAFRTSRWMRLNALREHLFKGRLNQDLVWRIS